MRKLLFLAFVSGQALAQIQPDAGRWKTWVIASGKEFRLAPPPTQKATEAELKQMQRLQSKQDAKAIRQIQHWNAGAPGYHWGHILHQIVPKGRPPFRELSLLHVAIYDATVAAWDTKYAYNRLRPTRVNASVKNLVPVPQSPSYPCEYSVAAGAAAAVLSYLFPAKADSIQQLARQAGESRVAAGVQYPSDVQAGFELGKQVAERVVARAKTDGSDAVWKGSVPQKPGLWNGTRPASATMGSQKTWVLDSTSQFRPAPPPDFTRDMAELKNRKVTEEAKARAFYYATQDFWSDITDQKIFEYRLYTNPPAAARVYALKNIAAYDAQVACWEAKYTYWGIRPDQYDTTFKPVLHTPPFPGYPSGHAATSSSVATVLGYLFPADAPFFKAKADECAESRFEGGIHFRTDNEMGLEMGRKVGEYILKRAKADGAGEPLGSVKE